MKTMPRLHALYVAMENAAGRYLLARKAMNSHAQRVASLADLVAQQPNRLDYRMAHRAATERHADAVSRTGLAYRLWQEASRAYDTLWTATHGRATGTVAPIYGRAA